MVDIAYFITPHGFGHAARACAVMNAVAERLPAARFHLFTKVPAWFFEQSCGAGVEVVYHELASDVGFIQSSALSENYDGTIAALSALYPLRPTLVQELAESLRSNAVRVVLCDIAAIGIAAAQQAQIPSVLIENFTWDFMYASYLGIEPRFAPFIEALKPLYPQATHRIQCEPIVHQLNLPQVHRVAPIARPPRSAARSRVRAALGVPEQAPLVVCSMGGAAAGVSSDLPFHDQPEVYFVLAGTALRHDLPNNVQILPARSPIYHPDLMVAADAVIGKVGYSTVAEAYYARTQFLYIPRPLFAESEVMERFVTLHLNGAPIAPDEGSFLSGSWVRDLPDRLCPVSTPLATGEPNGAEQVGVFIQTLLTSQG